MEQAHAKKDTLAEAKARKQRDLLAARQRQLDAELHRRLPRLAELQYPAPLDLKQAQQALAPGVLLLAYAVEESNVFLFVVTRDSFHHYTLPVTGETLAQQARAWSGRLTRLDATRDEYEPLARKLYDTLVRPAQQDVARAQRVLICPDGVLHSLPFGALMPGPNHFLIQDKPIYVTVSMTAYQGLEAAKPKEKGSTLALGDPEYKAAVSASYRATIGPKLVRLPRTRSQVESIRQMYPASTTVLLGKTATRTQLLAHCGDARIIHLACHGYADSRDPFGSWLALTPENAQDTGLLYAWQVLGMRLNADLVTLAACETGLGTESATEGVMGLARAFQIAGAQSVVVSLWSVDEESTTQLMTGFYRALKAGQPKDAALRQAQMAVMKTDPRPYLWAGFVLNGSWK